jgi:hypothetical protein
MSFVLGLDESGDSLYIQRREYVSKHAKTVFVRNAKSEDGVFTFQYIGEVITDFEIPTSNVYKIEAWGASGGGTDTAPKGAFSMSFVTLNKGERLQILVGEKGYDGVSGYSGCSSSTIYCAGGGGGSFVAKGETPLCVAGGGGGNGRASPNSTSSYACGQSGKYGGDSQSRQVELEYGGLSGSSWTGGGGGFRYNGSNPSNSNGKGGFSFLSGGWRQNVSWRTGYAYGGFGGGGSTNGCCGGSGGGGGYTGGGGSLDNGSQAGGGGSYFTGEYGGVNSTAISGCDSFPTKPTPDLNGYVRLTIMNAIPSAMKRNIYSCVLHRFEMQWILFTTLISS